MARITDLDYGLLNATGAADLIAADDLEGGLIVEGVIKDGQNIYYRYYCDGTSDISVTLCWNDPAHAPIAPALNPTTATLVHDLDLYVIDPSSIYSLSMEIESRIAIFSSNKYNI